MLDPTTVPLLGTLETDPDAIPRGFIHRDPDILNIHQQNTLTEMKVKMMDFNSEYLAKHPQVEALVRLLIKEIIIHKPYYVREFIKEILSRDDLETTVAKIVAAKGINTNRRHTRHYFSHTKTWEQKAAGINEPDVQLEELNWPEPRPFRVESRRDKREYCHPHYFKVPYVFFPAEYLKPKEPVYKSKKYPEFRSRSYARLVLKNFKDVWGDPVTGVPPPLNDEEVYTAYSLLKKKPEKDMTNEELIKCCLRCRRTRLRSYIYAMNKKQFNDPLKKYPSYEILQKSLKLRVANRFMEKTIEALKKKEVKSINCAWMPQRSPLNDVDRQLMKFETSFIPHRPLAQMDDFKSPIPGIRFKEEGRFRLTLPLADLKRNVDRKSELNTGVTVIEPSRDHKRAKVTVPTTDLHGNVVDHSVISIAVRSMGVSDNEGNEESCIRLGERKIGDGSVVALDEKHLLLEQTRIQKSQIMGEGPSEITMAAAAAPETLAKMIQYDNRGGSARVSSRIGQGSLRSLRSGASSVTQMMSKDDSFMVLTRLSSGDRIETYLAGKKITPKDRMPSLPPHMVDPYMQMLIDTRKLKKHLKKQNECNRKCKLKRKMKMKHLEQYM